MTPDRLRHALIDKRKAQHLSLRDLAPILGLSFASIGRIERGEGALNELTRQKLLAWLRGEDPLLLSGAPAKLQLSRGLTEAITALIDERLARVAPCAGCRGPQQHTDKENTMIDDYELALHRAIVLRQYDHLILALDDLLDLLPDSPETVQALRVFHAAGATLLRALAHTEEPTP